jgi:hypothetical protein
MHHAPRSSQSIFTCRYWQQQQACALKGVNLTPELCVVLLLLTSLLQS